MPDIRLRIDGKDFLGWEKVEISQSLEAVAGRFELEVSKSGVPFPVEKGQACQLFDGPDKLVDGWIDTVDMGLGDREHSIHVTGRDRTYDLVDCSATNPSQEFLNIGFETLLEKLAEPFGVPVTVAVKELSAFKKFSLQQESAFEAIERACRLRGVLPLPAANGGLRIVPYGESRAGVALEQGKNLKAITLSYDWRERFSEYIVYRQQPGSDELDVEATTALKGRAKDSAVTRYRPLVVMAEGAVTPAVAQDRAEWEAAVRAARSLTTTVTVQGWREKGEEGPHWAVNRLVPVIIPGLDKGDGDDMLIRDVTRILSDSDGTITRMTLTHKEAYLKKPDARETKRKHRHKDAEE